MKKMKRFLSFALCLVCIFSTFSSMAVSASAANVCQDISGSSSGKVTFYVITKKAFVVSDKITLTQNKGTIVKFNGKTKDVYAGYNIIIEKIDGGTKKADKREIRWNFSKSVSFTLQKNATYKITVSPDSYTTHYLRYSATSWKSYCAWSVSKTRGVDFCY